jgi:hypothetical protein
MILTGVGWQILGIILGWSFMAFLGISLWTFLRDAFKVSHRMHQIPCTRCQFFTNCAALKCTVHPDIALSEQAIQCPDFAPNGVSLQ